MDSLFLTGLTGGGENRKKGQVSGTIRTRLLQSSGKKHRFFYYGVREKDLVLSPLIHEDEAKETTYTRRRAGCLSTDPRSKVSHFRKTGRRPRFGELRGTDLKCGGFHIGRGMAYFQASAFKPGLKGSFVEKEGGAFRVR